MSISLLPPLTRSGPFVGAIRQQALTEGPAYARSGAGSRWHRVRSATRNIVEGVPGTIAYHAWCGQLLYSGRSRALDAPDDGAPVCGTCEGRALGYDPARPELLFTPETLIPPRWCPARRLYEDVGINVGRCLACGQLVPVKVYGWNGRPKLQQHEPLELVPGCPFHAWRYLVAAGETAVCQCAAEAVGAADA